VGQPLLLAALKGIFDIHDIDFAIAITFGVEDDRSVGAGADGAWPHAATRASSSIATAIILKR
jgi:hypothetical protein